MSGCSTFVKQTRLENAPRCVRKAGGARAEVMREGTGQGRGEQVKGVVCYFSNREHDFISRTS